MLRLVAFGVVCCVAAACAEVNDETSVAGAPTTVTAVETDEQPSPFCPLEAPANFRVGTSQGRVDFSWTAVTGIPRYQIEVERLEPQGWRHDASLTAEGSSYEWYPRRTGSYRARVRSLTACGTEGGWSNTEQFSVGEEMTAAPPASPLPPGPPSMPNPNPPLVSCGGIAGHFIADFSSTTLIATSSSGAFAAKGVSIPAGTYTVRVETRDAAHTIGYQPDQTEESVTVSVRQASGSTVTVGTTADLPENQTSAVFDFGAVSGPITEVRLTHAAYSSQIPHSIHGICVAFIR